MNISRRRLITAGIAASTAAAGPVRRALFRPARAASAGIDVSKAGADRTGRSDSTAAIAAVLQSLTAHGGAVYFPAGTYLVSRTLLVPSNVTLSGDGPTSVIKAAQHFDPGTTYGFFIFTNAHNPALQFSTKQPPVGTVLDRNIRLGALKFDGSLVPKSPIGGIYPAAFRCVAGAAFTGIDADTTAGVAMMIGCSDYSFAKCRATAISSAAFDNWAGAKNATITDCTASPRDGASGANAVQFNGQPGFPSVSSGLRIDGCEFHCGIDLDTLATECTVSDVSITNSTVALTGAAIGVIIGRGAIRNVTIRNCKLSGGKLQLPTIWLDQGAAGGKFTGDPDFITIDNNQIDSSQIPPVQNVIRLFCGPKSHVTVTNNTVTGTYGTALNLNGGTAKGGRNSFKPGRVMTIYGKLDAT